MPSSRALAIAAHPDDIEFLMAGTLCLLRQGGWEIHYLNLSTGNLGSVTRSATATARTRRREARAAATLINAVWHAPFCRDLEISYDTPTLRRVCAVVRAVAPTVILTHSPQDYMEDHVNTARLAVTAAFARGAPNYRSTPPRSPVSTDVTIYHASQRQWLEASQGMDNYLSTMDEFSRELGRLSGRFKHAEGWRRHSHWGFCAEDADPLRAALGRNYLVNAAYERSLES